MAKVWKGQGSQFMWNSELSADSSCCIQGLKKCCQLSLTSVFVSLSPSPHLLSLLKSAFFFLNWHVFDLQYCVSFRCTTMQFSYTYVHWRRTWQPTPVFLPGESQGWEPGGLPSMGSHRVGHYWRDLAAVAVYICTHSFLYSFVLWFIVGWASQVTQW